MFGNVRKCSLIFGNVQFRPEANSAKQTQSIPLAEVVREMFHVEHSRRQTLVTMSWLVFGECSTWNIGGTWVEVDASDRGR